MVHKGNRRACYPKRWLLLFIFGHFYTSKFKTDAIRIKTLKNVLSNDIKMAAELKEFENSANYCTFGI